MPVTHGSYPIKVLCNLKYLPSHSDFKFILFPNTVCWHIAYYALPWCSLVQVSHHFLCKPFSLSPGLIFGSLCLFTFLFAFILKPSWWGFEGSCQTHSSQPCELQPIVEKEAHALLTERAASCALAAHHRQEEGSMSRPCVPKEGNRKWCFSPSGASGT